ncbi:MAG: TonB-dependent receptor [Bacteroidaceae bacterium]|nr:TonB-dependent receptor [Bacteroidaceae bacterium]
MKYRLIALTMFLFMGIHLMAQSMDVEGTVVDSNGEPIIGVTVSVKNSNARVITDFDGKFKMKGVKASATLIFSYVGMLTQELKVKDKMSVVMDSEAQTLDDVLVVAFGQQKRSSFTGSAAVVDSKDLELRQVTNVVSALDGQVAGLQMVSNSGAPDASPTLLIRGVSSINSGTEPLIIVDGAPFEAGLNNINPSDIESVTVLKDAASNALYGARGANGVIMITTKQAQRGDAKVSFDAKWGANMRGTQRYETINDPRLYYETYYKSLYNYYVANGNSYADAHVMANNTMGQTSNAGGLGYIVYTAPQGEYLIGENGKMNPNASLGNRVYNKGEYYTLMPDDWFDNAYRTGFRQEYNVNVNGGNDRGQFYASVGYLKNQGIVQASDFNRFTGRLKASYLVKKWLRVGGNANYSHSVSNNLDNDDDTNLFAMLASTAPIYPVFLRDGNGNIMKDERGEMYDYGNGAVNGVLRPVIANVNPLQSNSLDVSTNNSNMYSIYGFVDVMPIDGLKITANGTATQRDYRRTSTVSPYYGYGAMAFPTGNVFKGQYRYTNLNFQQLINYTKSFGKHNMTLLLGHEYYEYNYEYISGTKTGMADYWGNQELNGAVTTVSTYSAATSHNTEGIFFRGLYDYDDKYFANASYRRDASSRFHPDHRWGNFFSFGAAWMMTKESWMKNAKWLNTLKLKASFGQQGNDNIGDFRYVDTYNINNLNGEVALTFNSKGSEKITWETCSSLNVGVEFDMFNGRFGGGIEYYNKKTTDMLLFVSDPLTSGYTGHYENVGDMSNNGVEVELRAIPVKTRDFSWGLNLNLTHNVNKVTYLSVENKGSNASYYNDGKVYQGAQSGNYFIGEGLPRHTWYLRHYLGVNDKGQALYACANAADGSGTTTVWSNADYVLCGSPYSDVNGGFGTSISYKGIALNVGFTYAIGGKVFDDGYRTSMTMPSMGYTGGALHQDVLNAWSATNTTSSIPRLQFNDLNSNYTSSRWLTDGSYLSLQSVNLSYTFPQKLVRAICLSNLRVYVSGENLYLWSKRKGLDPRSNSGFDGYCAITNYVPMRTLTAGISLNF